MYSQSQHCLLTEKKQPRAGLLKKYISLLHRFVFAIIFFIKKNELNHERNKKSMIFPQKNSHELKKNYQ